MPLSSDVAREVGHSIGQIGVIADAHEESRRDLIVETACEVITHDRAVGRDVVARRLWEIAAIGTVAVVGEFTVRGAVNIVDRDVIIHLWEIVVIDQDAMARAITAA